MKLHRMFPEHKVEGAVHTYLMLPANLLNHLPYFYFNDQLFSVSKGRVSSG